MTPVVGTSAAGPSELVASGDPASIPVQAREWLSEQIGRQRELLLVIDPLAEPNPIPELFGANLMQAYANVYLGTEFAALTSISPWLIHLPREGLEYLHGLLDEPQRHWGWLASAEHFELSVLVEHWQARMVVEDEAGQRSLYRFQDGRVIAHHLAHLKPGQRALLMGPFASALCWSGEAWMAFDNPAPGHYHRPFATPWLTIADPAPVAEGVRHHNLLQWLWQQHPVETAMLGESVHLDAWLRQQLAQAEGWEWRDLEQIRFLLKHRLFPALASHPGWDKAPGEQPEQHYLRCRTVIVAPERDRR